MADKFPDISSKLGAAPKKSLFERQKAEAEAKKARETAETAAVYEDFVKSFDDEGYADSTSYPAAGRGGGGAGSNISGGQGFSGVGGGGLGKRHFTSSGLKSGPGSLGPLPNVKSGPGSLGPVPPLHGRKRPYDDYQNHKKERPRGMFSYEDERPSPEEHEETAAAFRDDEDDEKDTSDVQAAAKPTLHLSSLPPGTSPAVIRALFTPSPLVIEDVRILSSPQANSNDRKSTSAIVTLAAETAATDIDTMVSHLQNKYLGFGFNLSISRHLSSTALGGTSALSAPSTSLHNLPFGAKPISQRASLSRAPPPGQTGNRFAPPASYTSSTPFGPRGNQNHPPAQVAVQVPTDLSQLKRIHKTLEALLTYGPEFEALLMSRTPIQQDENWSWLWDSRSVGGVYYRWRLWDILTDGSNRRKKRGGGYAMSNRPELIFEQQSPWLPPETGLKFEYTTRLSEFIDDEDYDSSDEEAEAGDDGGIARRYNDHNFGPSQSTEADNDGLGYLNPLAKTKLIHLLSRLPDSNAKLRKGDVARVTGFAIEHAGAGAAEVAELVCRNAIKPFRYNGGKEGQQTTMADASRDSDAEMADVEPTSTLR